MPWPSVLGSHAATKSSRYVREMGLNHQRSAGDEDYNTLDMLPYVLDF